CQQQDNMPLTF
nr:immunoglobulin light chain junction region [Macaca mulatta]